MRRKKIAFSENCLNPLILSLNLILSCLYLLMQLVNFKRLTAITESESLNGL